MLLDSLIIQLAVNAKTIRAQTVSSIEGLIKILRKLNVDMDKIEATNQIAAKTALQVTYFDPMIAFNTNLVRMSVDLSVDLKNEQTKTLIRLIKFMKSNRSLANKLHFLLRSILLSFDDLATTHLWLDALNLLLENAAKNTNASCDTIYFILYLLAKETDGRKQMELLRGLTSFATIKENVPLILNTYRSLSTSSAPVLRTVSIDLHTRLWLTENRTYQFLHKVLIADDGNVSKINKWEMNVVKANAIKTICSHK